MINFLIGAVAMLLLVIVGIPTAYHSGQQSVINDCRNYNRHYIEPRTDKDPMGYYLNCYVTTGPEVEVKKKK